MAAFYVWLRCHPRLVDGVLAAALAFLGLVQAFATDRYQLIPFVLVVCAPVTFRRAYPTGAFLISVTAGALQVVLDVRAGTADLAIVILLYTLAAYRPRRISIAGLGICLIGSAVAVAFWAPRGLSVLNWIMVGSITFAGPVLVAWVLGDSMRYRRAYYTSLEDRAARLERERDAQAQIAAAAERARIARELHDVIAHNVSVMVVQADGASYALDSSPERARQALGNIASTGRQALAEMRRMLGVLRSDDRSTGVVPLPGISQLGELLEQARATGLPVSFTVQGVPAPLPGGLALAAYRIVQESLTNTRKHGGAGARAAGAAAVLRGRAGAADHRRRPRRGGRRGRGRARADRHARAGRAVQRDAAGRPAAGRRLPGHRHAAGRRWPGTATGPAWPARGGGAAHRAGRSMSIRILLVDDQELVRTGFRMVLDAQDDMSVVGEAGDGLAATQLLRTRPADVVVMDVRMPELDGIEATRRICRAGDRPRVLMLTTFDLDEYAYAALQGRGQRFPAQGRPAGGTAVRHPRGALRGRGCRAVHHAPPDRPVRAAVPGGQLPRRRPGWTRSPPGSARFSRTSRRACPTRRSRSGCTCPRPRSRRTSAGCWPSSGCGTGCRPWCSPTRPAWSGRAAG